MQYDLKVIREDLMPKGYNDKLPPEYVPSGFLADAQNCVITDEKIVKRNGFTMIGNDKGSKAILGLHGIKTTDGVRRIYMFRNKDDDTAIEIWEWSGTGNWSLVDDTLLTNVGEQVNCVSAEDTVICFDGASTPAIITPASTSTAAAASDENFPAGTFGYWFHNFLFVAGVDDYPNRLYWSDLEDSDDFTNGVTGYVDINPDDGDEIIGLNNLKDELLIFKKNRIWGLTGFGTTEFTVGDINENITGFGAVSHQSIVNVGNDVLYMADVGSSPEFRSVNRTRYGTIVEGGVISDPITNTMESLERTQLGVVSGVFDGRRVYWACPDSGETKNDRILVYDTVNKGFVRWTGMNASCFTKLDFSGDVDIYFGDGDTDSKVYVFDSGDNDNGADIDFYVTTRAYGGDKPERKKKWKYCYVVAEKSGGYDLTVDQSPDTFTFQNLGAIDLSDTGTAFPISFDDAPLGESSTVRKRMDFAKLTSYYLQLKFSNDQADEPIAIRHWELLYKERALRDAKP